MTVIHSNKRFCYSSNANNFLCSELKCFFVSVCGSIVIWHIMDREQESDSDVHSNPEHEETRSTGTESPEDDSDDSLADIRYLEQVMDEITERQQRIERNREQDGNEIRAEDFVDLTRDELLGEPDFWRSITAQVNRVRDEMRALGARDDPQEEEEDEVRREIRERVDHHWRPLVEMHDAVNDESPDNRWSSAVAPYESISDYEDDIPLDVQIRGLNLTDDSSDPDFTDPYLPIVPNSSQSRRDAVPVLYNSAGEEIYSSEEE